MNPGFRLRMKSITVPSYLSSYTIKEIGIRSNVSCLYASSNFSLLALADWPPYGVSMLVIALHVAIQRCRTNLE